MTLTIDSERVLKQLIADGVELQAVQKVLQAWAEKHGYIMGGWSDNANRMMYHDGRLLEGNPEWLTYHEMLEACLKMIDGEEPPQQKTVREQIDEKLRQVWQD